MFIRKNLELFLQCQLNAEISGREPLFILRPTSVRIWHKAVFKVGPVAGPEPNAIDSSKNASDPVGIPFWARAERYTKIQKFFFYNSSWFFF